MQRARTRVAVLAFTGVSLVGVLAGCSSHATTASSGSSSAATHKSSSSHASRASDDSSAAATPSATADDNGGSTSGTDDTSFRDGSYSAQGTYSSPGGQELISVDLTLASDVVKSVTVKTVKADPTATSYEAKFISGISSVVVGKKISDLSVSKVAGSSLTSMGFNDALAKIKTDAKA